MIDLSNLLSAESLSKDSAVFLRDGARTFVGVLGAVAGGLLKDRQEVLQ